MANEIAHEYEKMFYGWGDHSIFNNSFFKVSLAKPKNGNSFSDKPQLENIITNPDTGHVLMRFYFNGRGIDIMFKPEDVAVQSTLLPFLEPVKCSSMQEGLEILTYFINNTTKNEEMNFVVHGTVVKVSATSVVIKIDRGDEETFDLSYIDYTKFFVGERVVITTRKFFRGPNEDDKAMYEKLKVECPLLFPEEKVDIVQE